MMKRYSVVIYVSFGPIGTPGREYWVNALTPEGAKAAALDEAGKEYPSHALIAGEPQPYKRTRAEAESEYRRKAEPSDHCADNFHAYCGGKNEYGSKCACSCHDRPAEEVALDEWLLSPDPNQQWQAQYTLRALRRQREEVEAERESERKRRANFNAVADGFAPPYPSEY